MQKQLIVICCALSVLFFHAGCSKDGDGDTGKTKMELLTQSSWKFQSAKSSLLGDVSANPMIACYTDNVITFSTNMSGTVSEGANVCSPASPSTFNWSFQSGETILRLSFTLFSGGSPDFNIVTLNETNLVLSQEVTIAPFPAQTLEVTFKH